MITVLSFVAIVAARVVNSSSRVGSLTFLAKDWGTWAKIFAVLIAVPASLTSASG
jgi:hypothetical protein